MPDIQEFIQVTTRLAAGGSARRQFGIGLLLTTDDALPAGGTGKVARYSNLSAVQDDFDAGDALDAATTWFSADPIPQNLYIGRWANTDVATTLQSATVTAAPDAAPLNSATATFTLNGNNVSVDLAAATTYAGIATAIQTAIVALSGIFTGATFAFANGRFLLTLAGDDAITDGQFGAGTTGNDIATALGMTTAAGAVYRQGQDTETIQEALAEMTMLTVNVPTYLFHDGGTAFDAATQTAIEAYVTAGDFMTTVESSEAAALATGDTTSQLATAFARQSGKVVPVYTEAGTHPGIGALAALSAINFDGLNAIISLHGKPIPGATASDVTDTQFAELQRKRANIYTTIGGLPTFVEGFTARTGTWADSQAWLLWIKNALEVAIWGALRGSRRLTVAVLRNELNAVMQQGVRNGGLQPGRRLSAEATADVQATTGNIEFNGELTAGYIIHIDPLADLTSAQRANRDAPPVKIWGALSPAIHRAAIDLVVEA